MEKKMKEKKDYLNPDKIVKHIDITSFNSIPIIEAMADTAFQARNLSRACQIANRMVADSECSIFLTLAGSLISAGMKSAIVELMKNNMIDAIISTGANIVDQDFLEALGFKHYQGTPFVNDNELRELMIDRIYDTYIDEDDLRVCDMTVAEIANSLDPRPYSSREFINEMGRWLMLNDKGEGSIIRTAYQKAIPIFVPAFSDCSAGFGFIHHQYSAKGPTASIDSAKDFLELTKIKIDATQTGILMLGGGVPKNFTQDVVVAAEVLGFEVPMHKYAVQITVADERDGGLSGSTLKEASSWGKVETTYEQMVFSEVTIAFPLLASYLFHKGEFKNRKERRYSDFLG
ncbi:MAG TPA: deoxyhypusine synthase [Candidatus Kapabacteria bacterium]|nr:deoxyhypusine synthase [Candidatus Kapabacteria bacterium]HOV91809.1 deoxyhypusine synthase [Candidatus Kapabacteria bacterium]